MDDWYEKLNGVVKKKNDQNCLHQQTLNYSSCDNLSTNYNNGISKQTRWDCTSQTTHISKLIIIIKYVNFTLMEIKYTFYSGSI